ncbi:MAG: cupredoxin domain-containing protein [Rickettsiales bacterium]|nr:cupredoxin domain-containing protein [Rickettsiales bacterium]
MKILFTLLFTVASTASFAARPIYTTTIKNHKFSPEVIEVKADEKFILLVNNQDETIEEFESHDLRIEKIIGGNKSAKFKIKALKKGEYEFVGEFHEKTAKGKIVAK